MMIQNSGLVHVAVGVVADFHVDVSATHVSLLLMLLRTIYRRDVMTRASSILPTRSLVVPWLKICNDN